MKPFTANAFHDMPYMLNFQRCGAAEIVKRRILGLHQDTEIGSVDITDTWEPLEEGLNRLETTRHVSVITITLSTVPLDLTSIGYQAPLEEEFVKPLQESAAPGSRGAGSSIAAGGPSRWAAIACCRCAQQSGEQSQPG